MCREHALACKTSRLRPRLAAPTRGQTHERSGGQRTIQGYPSGGRICAFAPDSGHSLGSELRRSARAPPSSADARQAAVATVIGDGSGALSKRGGIKIGCLRLLARDDLPWPPWLQSEQRRHSMVGMNACGPFAAQRRHLRTQRRQNGRRRSRQQVLSHTYMASLRLIRNKDEIPSNL